MKPEILAKAKEILLKHNKAAAIEFIDAVLFEALDEVVKASATPIDDVVLAALKEPLKAQLLKMISGL